LTPDDLREIEAALAAFPVQGGRMNEDEMKWVE
jgi:hypothetical protein